MPDPLYWHRVLEDPTAQIAITEGVKKAAALLTCGIPALALCGVEMGLLKKRSKLVPTLSKLAVKGRPVILAFDTDMTTKPEVRDALIALGSKLKAQGCLVSVATWDAQHKGVDDLLVASGSEAVKDAIENSQPLNQWCESLERKDFDSLLNRLDKIFAQSESAATQRWELIRLAKSTKIQVKDLTAIYDAWRDDQDDVEPMTLDQFRASVPTEREWLIANVLPGRTTGIVHSEAGCGKTLLFYDFAKAVALGAPWNGYPTKQGKVLIVQTDEPSSETSDRFEVSGIFEGVQADQILVLTQWGFSQIRKLQRWIETYQPAFVVIDSLTTANRRSAAEEKDSPYGHCLSDLRDLADKYGCSIWVLHHSNRQGGLRGTTAIEANVSEVWRLRKPNQKEDLGKFDRIIEVGKSRAGCTGNYHLRLDVDNYSWEWLGDKDCTAQTGNPSAELLSFMLLSPDVWFEPEGWVAG